MLFCQRTHKTHSHYHLVAVELPFIAKVIDCMHQTIKTYLEREHGILLSVTRTLLCLPSLSRCRSLFVKLGVKVNGQYRQYRRYQTHHRQHYFLRGRQRIGARALCVQHSPTAAALSTSFLLNHAPNSPELNASITRFRESHSSVNMSRESKRLKKSTSD